MFDLNIDHAAFMAQLETLWEMLNVNGLIGYFLNGLFVLAIFGMFSKVRMIRMDG